MSQYETVFWDAKDKVKTFVKETTEIAIREYVERLDKKLTDNGHISAAVSKDIYDVLESMVDELCEV